MYEISYGSRYDSKLTVKEIAARVRSEIKALVKSGALPADWKYSVRMATFAGGQSIDIRATSPVSIYLCQPNYYRAGAVDREIELPIKGAWRSCIIRAHDQWFVSRDDAEVPGVGYVRLLLDHLLRSYNYDGSEVQVDYFNVNFYGHVTIETAGGWSIQYERQLDYLPKENAA